jgi:hypothetical protein
MCMTDANIHGIDCPDKAKARRTSAPEGRFVRRAQYPQKVTCQAYIAPALSNHGRDPDKFPAPRQPTPALQRLRRRLSL